MEEWVDGWINCDGDGVKDEEQVLGRVKRKHRWVWNAF